MNDIIVAALEDQVANGKLALKEVFKRKLDKVSDVPSDMISNLEAFLKSAQAELDRFKAFESELKVQTVARDKNRPTPPR